MYASCVDCSFVGVEKQFCRWLEDGGHASWSFTGERPAHDVMRVETAWEKGVHAGGERVQRGLVGCVLEKSKEKKNK